MKSGGFHVKSKDLLQGIVTLCFYIFIIWIQIVYIICFSDAISNENSSALKLCSLRVPAISLI